MIVKDELSYTIIGCAMKVHNTIGNGFQEIIYQRCLGIELRKAELNFATEVSQAVYYDGIKVGTRRSDFIVENMFIIELKTTINLEDVHLAQTKNYLTAYGFEKGLLVKFHNVVA